MSMVHSRWSMGKEELNKKTTIDYRPWSMDFKKKHHAKSVIQHQPGFRDHNCTLVVARVNYLHRIAVVYVGFPG